MNEPEINIYQIHYLDEQKKSLEKDFIPYFNYSTTGKKWFEYFVFKDEFEKRKNWENKLVGYVSWKFGTKTAISGSKFIDFIKNNPGQDVYFVNPFYIESLMYKSQWEGAEYHHPGIIELTEFIFKSIGYDTKYIHQAQDLKIQLYANYWVGNEKFWKKYIEFTNPIFDFIENSKDKWFQEQIMKRADTEIVAPYIPFIIERIFSLILMQDESIKFASYQYSEIENQTKYKLPYEFFTILETFKNIENEKPLPIEYSNYRTEFRNTNENFDKEMKVVFKFRSERKIFKVFQYMIRLKSVIGFCTLYKKSFNFKDFNLKLKFKLKFNFVWKLKFYKSYYTNEGLYFLFKKIFFR